MIENYLFTVMSNNTPHELISLVKLVSNFIISKPGRRKIQRYQYYIVGKKRLKISTIN